MRRGSLEAPIPRRPSQAVVIVVVVISKLEDATTNAIHKGGPIEAFQFGPYIWA